jgi:hypothetical protein
MKSAAEIERDAQNNERIGGAICAMSVAVAAASLSMSMAMERGMDHIGVVSTLIHGNLDMYHRTRDPVWMELCDQMITDEFKTYVKEAIK